MPGHWTGRPVMVAASSPLRTRAWPGVVQVSTFEPAGTAPRIVVGAPSLTHGPHVVVDSRMDSHTPDAGPVTP